MFRISYLTIKVSSSKTSTNHKKNTLIIKTSNNFFLKPLNLLLPLMGISTSDTVIKNNHIGSGTINLSTNT